VATVIVAQAATNLVQGAPLDAFHRLDIRRRFPNLKPHFQAQLSLGLLANAHNALRARHVHRDRFLAIYVLSCRDHVFQEERMKVRRSRDEDEVHFFRRRDLLVSSGAVEELRGINGRVALCLLVLIEVFAAALELVSEEIHKGDHARIGVVHEPCSYRRGASSATQNPHAQGRIRLRTSDRARL
jgi:hypothetical protein